MNLVETVSKFLLDHISHEHFLKVRSLYLSCRKKLEPLMSTIYGRFDVNELIAEIDARIDSDWQVLMVHSSTNNLYPMFKNNPLELLDALKEYAGPERTLVMPAFFFGEDGLGVREVLEKNPRFDLRRKPSHMGLLTELFRRSRGCVQSRHPIYRVAALGPHAEELVKGHELVPSGMGRDTPFDFMARHNSQIIGIGKTFQVMTQVHQVEALMGDEFPVPSHSGEKSRIVLVDGDHEVEMDIGGRGYEWNFDISRLRNIVDRSLLKEWRFHHVPMFAAKAGDVTDALVAAAKKGEVLYKPN